ncbi:MULTISPECIES: hypothetical protein [unclassified Gordonia (in: high G+C Gram-positive bacteria)]|nr:hypothetical protein [Gordonia sp. ABSL49_1]
MRRLTALGNTGISSCRAGLSSFKVFITESQVAIQSSALMHLAA